MNFSCPFCGRKLNLMELQAEEDIVAIIKMQPVFSQHAPLVWGYLELFNITPMKAKTKKIRIIMNELMTLFQAEAFNYQKKIYNITKQGIAEALGIIIHRHFETPLTSHGYLKAVMLTISERESKDKSRSDEKELKNREAHLVNREADHLSTENVKANLERVGNIIKSIGGKK